MANKTSVKLTHNFERNLQELEVFRHAIRSCWIACWRTSLWHPSKPAQRAPMGHCVPQIVSATKTLWTSSLPRMPWHWASHWSPTTKPTFFPLLVWPSKTGSTTTDTPRTRDHTALKRSPATCPETFAKWVRQTVERARAHGGKAGSTPEHAPTPPDVFKSRRRFEFDATVLPPPAGRCGAPGSARGPPACRHRRPAAPAPPLAPRWGRDPVRR